MTFYIAIVTALLLIYILLILPGNLPPNADNRLWKYSYAHRGLHKEDKSVPENSMSAFAKAIEAGYGIELDINLTSDGKIIVFHDDNLLRICGVNKLITDCTYDELCQYRLCNTDERIPLFSEVLALVNGQVPLIVELKNTKQNDELCLKAAEQLDVYQGSYCVESFNPIIVRWFYKNRHAVVRGQLSVGHRSLGDIPWWKSLVLSSLLTNAVTRPHFVAYKHQDAHRKLCLSLFHFLGGKLVGWTVRDTDNIEYCRNRFDVIIFEFIKP